MAKSIEQSLRHKGMLKGTMTFGQVDSMYQSAIYVPILAMIGATFVDAGAWLNQSLAIVQLVMMFAIVFSGWLSKFIDKKTILVLGSMIFLAGGLLCGIAANIYMLVIFRALIGLGAGLAFPIVPTVISLLFSGNERAQLMGWMNAGASLCSIFLNLILGYVVTFSWRMSSVLYIPIVFIVFLQIIFLPNIPAERKQEKTIENKKGGISSLGVATWAVTIGMFLFTITSNLFIFELARYVGIQGIGGAKETGWASAVMSAFAMLVGFSYGGIYKALGRFSCVLSCVCIAAAYFVLSGISSLWMLFVAMGLMGCGMGTFFPYFGTTMSTTCTSSALAIAMSAMFFAKSIGTYITSWYDLALNYFTGNNPALTLRYNCFFYAIMAVIMFLLCTFKKSTMEKYVLRNEKVTESAGKAE
jgi:MFS family permease